jgi:hypothetical protein
MEVPTHTPPLLPLSAALLEHVVASGAKNPEETTALLVEEKYDLFVELLEVDQPELLKVLALCKVKHQIASKIVNYCLLYREPCDVWTNAELVANVSSLGSSFQSYAVALEEQGKVGGEYLEALTASQMELLFVLVPKAHQAKLEVVFRRKSQVQTPVLEGEGHVVRAPLQLPPTKKRKKDGAVEQKCTNRGGTYAPFKQVVDAHERERG